MMTSHPSERREPETNVELNPFFSRPGESTIFPRFTIPDGESLPGTAYQVVHDEVMLDGNSRLNLPTFVGPGWNRKPRSCTRQPSTRTARLPSGKRAVTEDRFMLLHEKALGYG
ncbi:hypothetical protein NicSoilB11_31350 [Arthrobacter sp. NicSoilB11]|nr:hypothetical protein NicSoilB11_31350 [Arthrobacter sp. NicSoilB11]